MYGTYSVLVKAVLLQIVENLADRISHFVEVIAKKA